MTDEIAERVKLAAQALIAAGAREVYLFGSAATGKMREDSDIDLAVAGLPDAVFFKAMGKAGEILQRPLDLVDLDDDNLLTEYLKRKGKLIRVG
ncbi:MAG: nucleotidyltransferase domain-containing protein [Candidatus Hydrogenedentes bacterium]|nr:nucleotidyltransferase domain-containing protein [Candidatus Hydrogenedentota bacterium]